GPGGCRPAAGEPGQAGRQRGGAGGAEHFTAGEHGRYPRGRRGGKAAVSVHGPARIASVYGSRGAAAVGLWVGDRREEPRERIVEPPRVELLRLPPGRRRVERAGVSLEP